MQVPPPLHAFPSYPLAQGTHFFPTQISLLFAQGAEVVHAGLLSFAQSYGVLQTGVAARLPTPHDKRPEPHIEQLATHIALEGQYAPPIAHAGIDASDDAASTPPSVKLPLAPSVSPDAPS